VVGPVERKNTGSMRVLGQQVDISQLAEGLKVKAGDVVAVHGIRRPDGTIVASLVEVRAHERHYLVRGLAVVKAGALLVGRLKIGAAPSPLAHRRVQLTLTKAAGGYKVVHLEAEAPVPQAHVADVLYETFLQRRGHRLESGLGIAVDDQNGDVKSTGVVRAFLEVGFDREGDIVSASRERGDGRHPGMPGNPPGRDGPMGPGGPGGGPDGPGGRVGPDGPGAPGGSDGPGGPNGPGAPDRHSNGHRGRP
jgi:hypothetical protein